MYYSLKYEHEKETSRINQEVRSTSKVVVSITLVVHRRIWFDENEVYGNHYFSTVPVCPSQQIRTVIKDGRKVKAN